MKIIRKTDTTVSEILRYGFQKCLQALQEINIAATQEYILEQNLQNMKNEWNNICIQHELDKYFYFFLLHRMLFYKANLIIYYLYKIKKKKFK